MSEICIGQRIRHNAAVVLASGAAVLAGTVGVELAAPETVAAHKDTAATHPATPNSFIVDVNLGADRVIPGSPDNIAYRKILIGDHHLLRIGSCAAGSGPNSYPADNIKEINDTLKGEENVPCPQLDETPTFTPRNEFTASGYGIPSMNYKPLMQQLSTKAAESVGLQPNQYGTPNKVLITFNPSKHFSQAKFFYPKNSHHTSDVKQIRELTFTEHGGKETVTDAPKIPLHYILSRP